jgi:hypothetical protein
MCDPTRRVENDMPQFMGNGRPHEIGKARKLGAGDCDHHAVANPLVIFRDAHDRLAGGVAELVFEILEDLEFDTVDLRPADPCRLPTPRRVPQGRRLEQ